MYPSLGNSTTRITHSEGQVVGGYYADPAAECQVFHVCATDSAEAGPNSKWSFLCPNGTIFNQNYFICDWWFNFDCAEAEDFMDSMTNWGLLEMIRHNMGLMTNLNITKLPATHKRLMNLLQPTVNPKHSVKENVLKKTLHGYPNYQGRFLGFFLRSS